MSDGEPDAPASSAFLVPSSCRMVTPCIQYPTVTCMVVRFFTCFQEPSELVSTCSGEPGSTNFNCAGGVSPRLGLVWLQTTDRESCSGVVGWGGTVHARIVPFTARGWLCLWLPRCARVWPLSAQTERMPFIERPSSSGMIVTGLEVVSHFIIRVLEEMNGFAGPEGPEG